MRHRMRAVRCFPTVTCRQSQCYCLYLPCALYMFSCISHSHNKIEKLTAIKKNYVEMLSIAPTTETMPGTELGASPLLPVRALTLDPTLSLRHQQSAAYIFSIVTHQSPLHPSHTDPLHFPRASCTGQPHPSRG